MTASPQPVRATAWEWAQTALLASNLAWTTLSLGGFLPGTRVVMTLLSALLLVVHFCDPSRARAHPAGWLFIPFLAYAACNVAWVSPVRWIGWTDWLNWAQAIAVFWIVLNAVRSSACRRLLSGVILSLGLVSAAMGAYQHFFNAHWLMLGRRQIDQYNGRATGAFGIPNSQGVLMALLIPPVAALALEKGRPARVRLAAALALVVLVTGFTLAVSRGAWLALAAALLLRAAFAPGRAWGRRLAGAAGVLVAAAGALALLYAFFPVMHERMNAFVADAGERTRPIMWRAAWGIFREHPLFGGGAGGFDTLFEAFRPQGFLGQPVYAHCDYLNTLCDYGLFGFLLFFGAAGFIMARCAGARGLGGAAFTGLLAFALHLLVDFHLKIPALAMIAASLAALVTAGVWPAPSQVPVVRTPLVRAVGAALGAAVLLGAIFWARPRYRAEMIRWSAREKIDAMAASGADMAQKREELAGIRLALGRAVALDPTNPQSLADKAYADSLWALVEPAQTHALGVLAAAEAAKATAIVAINAEFWVREGAALDMQQRWLEGGDCNARALLIAPMRADIWYYRAYHLSLDPIERGPALAAVNVSLRLDPGFLLAQALRQRLAP